MWFSGSIAEAIAKAKQNNTLLAIFVYGKDEKSEIACKSWESEEIQSICSNDTCIALKFDADSIEAKQFAEFYPLVCIPISFLISGDGIPLEIIIDVLNAAQLKDRLSTCLSKLPKKPSENVEAGPSSDLTSKIDKTKALIKEAKEKKEKAAEEEERSGELKRREEGKSLQQVKEKQRELEILAAAEERKKDKKADQEYLKRLKEQIAADRAEKANRFNTAKQEDEESRKKRIELQQAAQQRAAADLEDACKQTRIQFRLSDGGSVVQQFDSDRPFSEAYTFISSEIKLKSSDFHLIQMYPRREFTLQDSSKTFKELDLAPSSVLMVLETKKNRAYGSVQQYQGNWLYSMFSLLMTPVVTVYNWVYYFVFPPAGGAGSSTIPEKPSTSRGNSSEREESNIRRLSDNSKKDGKDDDDNATWNGNSTQQL